MTEIAIVVYHARRVRTEAEAVRYVAIVLSGRPIVAIVLHIAYIGAIVETCSGKEDRTCSLQF